MIVLYIFLLIIGFVVLIKGADIFVDGASSLARNFSLSTMFIGLTIVSFGTSAPEFAVSVSSIVAKNPDMVLGNVIGSNIINILLILGCASLVHSLGVRNNTVKKELPIVLLLTMLLTVLISDNLFGLGKNMFSRQDGVIILLFFTVFVYYLISMMRKKKDDDDVAPKYNISKSVVLTLLGITGIILGSQLVVKDATKIAEIMGVSQRMISLTVIALGTSLPELVTTVIAAKKGEYDIAIGNVVGSNIFNIGIVLALPVAVFGGINHIVFNYIDLIALLGSAILLFIFSFRDRKINKYEGIFMLTLFTIYYGYVILG